MRVRLAIAVGLVLVLAAAALELSDSRQRLAGSNARVSGSGNEVRLAPGERTCQVLSIPGQTAALRVFPGAPTGVAGPLDASIESGGGTVATAGFGRVRDEVVETAELTRPLQAELVGARVCFRNRGPVELRLAGDRTPVLYTPGNPYGVIFPDEPRVDFMRAGEESWWDLAGTVAERFGLIKTSFTGPWTLWAVLALLAATWVASVALLLRRLPGR
jgi:hypothetical protein